MIEKILYLYRKKHNILDRNYFLSCGHKVTFLLLLVAVGKLNTKLVSVMRTNPELSYCTDSKNHLQGCLADVSFHLCSEAGNDEPVINRLPAHQKGIHAFYDKNFLYNLSSFNKIKLGVLSNKWIYSYQRYMENIYMTFREVKKLL